jgi:hypothetical protein
MSLHAGGPKVDRTLSGSVGVGVTEAPPSTSSLVQDAPTGEDTTMNVVGEDRFQLT